MTAKQILESLRSGVIPELGLLRQLARNCAHDRDSTAELFRELVEPLSDSFEPEACQQYAAVFSEMIAELAPEFDASQLRHRYRTLCEPRAPASVSSQTLRQIFVLSRVTLGADIAVSSVFLNAANQAFPNASIAFVGNRKNAELWAADPRITFLEAPYDRTGTLEGRILAYQPLLQLLGQPGSLVIDPDSRLTQLGLIPVCADDHYTLFNSRAFGANTNLTISQLASQWCEQNFGIPDARAYIAPKPVNAEPRITVSFGVGENPAKRVSEAFEIAVLQHLVRLGAKVLVDQGAGGEEAVRVKHAVNQTSGVPGQVEMFNGPFAAFAAHIARSPLYIGYDSAGQHAAAALGIPGITVFAGYPNQRFLDRWKPESATSRVFLSDQRNLIDAVCRAITETLPST